MGVEKNQNVSTFERMSLMSRKCTVSADRASANPVVSTSCTSTITGNHARSVRATCRGNNQEDRHDGQPEQEVHHVGQHGDDREHLGGNSTFLIRLPPEISTLDASDRDEENQSRQEAAEQEQRVGLDLLRCMAGSTTAKTKE